MHGQATSTANGARSDKRAVRYRMADAEQRALALISEQVAIPLDQLGRLLGCPIEEAIRVTQRLDKAGCLCHRRFLAGDLPWFWLTARGAELAGTGYPARRPNVKGIAHRRALNEIRLYLAERAPQGKWVCEREVYRRRDPADHIPDAIFEIGGERHAIEAELHRKLNDEIRQILADHSRRYDAVIYFCAPIPYRLMTRLAAEGRYPKLAVRAVPEGPRW